MVGSTVALPSSIFCLCVNLERIASLREVRSTNAERRRRKIFDCVLCFVVPAVYMALRKWAYLWCSSLDDESLSDYVVQGHRFDIVENFGCRPTIYISIASIFIIWIPPALFTIAGGILSGARHFIELLGTVLTCLFSPGITPLFHSTYYLRAPPPEFQLCSNPVTILPSYCNGSSTNHLEHSSHYSKHVVFTHARSSSMDQLGGRPLGVLPRFAVPCIVQHQGKYPPNVSPLVDDTRIVFDIRRVLRIRTRCCERVPGVLRLGETCNSQDSQGREEELGVIAELVSIFPYVWSCRCLIQLQLFAQIAVFVREATVCGHDGTTVDTQVLPILFKGLSASVLA